MKHVFTVAKSGHPMEGYTLGGAFIVFKQVMQGFDVLGMLSPRMCSHVTPCHLKFGAIWWEL